MRLPLLTESDECLDEAFFSEVGAVRLKLTKDDREVIANGLRAAQEFHSLPLSEKLHFHKERWHSSSGFYPSSISERESLEFIRGVRLQIDETSKFAVGRSYDTMDWYDVGQPSALSDARRLLHRPKEFDEVLPKELLRAIDDVRCLGRRLRRAVFALIERVGELPNGYFEKRSRHPIDQVRLMLYPPGLVSGLKSHTDYEVFTVCADSVGAGLEIRDSRGQWHIVEERHDEVTILVGDLASLACNGRVAAATHRVKVSGDVPRYSLVYFAGLDFDARVSPIGHSGRHSREGFVSSGVGVGPFLCSIAIRNHEHLLAGVREGRLLIDFEVPGENPLSSRCPSIAYSPAREFYP